MEILIRTRQISKSEFKEFEDLLIDNTDFIHNIEILNGKFEDEE
jgi:hypothetical protein